MSRAETETGFMLIELLVAIGMLLVVVTATLTALNGFSNATRANFAQNDAHSAARVAVDRLARELRGTGSPGLPDAPIERAGPYDLVFDTVDPLSFSGGANSTSIVRVRYCLNKQQDRLWKQVQSWTSATRPALPTTDNCPHSSFGNQSSVAGHVVNQGGSVNRAVFTYDSGTLSAIAAIGVELLTDANAAQAPGAQRLGTTLYLRNQNRPPIASFTATLTGSRHVLLNGSSSSDPDGDDLTFEWYDGSTLIGKGPLFDYGSSTAGSHTLSLKVIDSGGMATTSAPQTVEIT